MNTSLQYYSGPWGEKQLRHLLSRTLFGVKKEDYDFFKDKNMDECVNILISQLPLPPAPIADSNDEEIPEGTSFVFAPENKDKDFDRMLLLKGWWVGLMINQPKNITEKMVLFWHNHFVIEFSNIQDSRYAYQYLDTIRKHALGDFKLLTREITSSPAMLVYLNGNQNNKAAPNENYGRELQELFTIGKGINSNYTEADVKAAAKILSGWKDDKEKISSYFDPEFHDTSDKEFSEFYGKPTIHGKAGPDGAKETDELIDKIFDNKEVSKFLCRKLYRWFVHFDINDEVENTVITPLAEMMVKSNYKMEPVLKAMFSSEFFYNPYLVGGMFKSPVDYLVGLLRELNVPFSGGNSVRHYTELWAVASTLGLMGQDLGDPPSVAGWPAYYEFPFYYKVWINSENITFRSKLAKLLSYPEESDSPLTIDFVGFVSIFPTVGNAKLLLSDILKLVCIVQPGQHKMAYMENQLNMDNTWATLWNTYKDQPNDEKTKSEIIKRLRSLFDIIFTLPEFQIM